MNYKESSEILEEIKKAKRILVNCHRGPDSDSIGSALALSKVLKSLGKDVAIICPSDIPSEFKFLPGSSEIKRIDFGSFGFSEFDLFIALDSSTWGMVSGNKEIPKPKCKFVVIDHHYSNERFGDINLVDDKVTSTGELLYSIFIDWKVNLDKEIADCLLTGILGDTGVFQYQGVGKKTLKIAGELMDLGADKDNIVFHIQRSVPFTEIKLWGKVIENMKFDEENKFVWSAIDHQTFKDFNEPVTAKEDVANLFFPIVKETEFGIVMIEIGDRTLSVSFRARSNFDVSTIAKEVGGGGHKVAAGAKVEGLPFDEAVEKVLATARKYAKKD